MKLLLLVLAAVGALGRGQSFYAAGAAGLAQSSPKTLTWFAVATELSHSNGLWWYNEADYIKAPDGRIISSPRTGALALFRDYGRLKLFGLGDAGMAIAGQSVSGAFAGGGLAVIHIRGFDLLLADRVLHTSTLGSQQSWVIGLGGSFK